MFECSIWWRMQRNVKVIFRSANIKDPLSCFLQDPLSVLKESSKPLTIYFLTLNRERERIFPNTKQPNLTKNKAQYLIIECLSPLPSYIKILKFKYFKAIFWRNKRYSGFRHLFNRGRNRQFKANFRHIGFKKEQLTDWALENLWNMLGRCVVWGCSAFPDVQKGLTLHATSFLDDERPEEMSTEMDWFQAKCSLQEIPRYVRDTLLKTTIFDASASLMK